MLTRGGEEAKTNFTDHEGAMNKEAMQKYLQEQNMEHHRTGSHPNFNERAIRTFKDLSYRRAEADEKNHGPRPLPFT